MTTQNRHRPQMVRWFKLTAAALGAVLWISGCAHHSASSQTYTYGQSQREQVVRYGVVESVRPITIQADRSSGIGAASGAAMGGVAASTIGGGRGKILATMGGALLGGIAGEQVEHRVQKSKGLEITVKMDNGETRVIAQEADVPINAGQRVQVISGAGPVRVSPI
ncbi:MAG TPA: glycine zipper 2TM domain-containing protein [Paenalcaligenes sp.]|nr:glycine zipper 2TM domain-containing protein [Paenalcaligenes sp.]